MEQNIIKKEDKIYTVTETKEKWKLKAITGKVSLSYEISKSDCKTMEDLRQYVADNSLL